MDLNYNDEERRFRDEVRDFLRDNLPERLSEKVRLAIGLTKDEIEEWHAVLNARGWLAGNWPREHGGAGWSAIQRHIFEEESARAFAPRILPFGVAMLGPVLQQFGSKAQQEYYLPRILSGEDWWCQGYSEPGAGSDLASLKCRAQRDGDHYVVNGQKTWTTLGQHANMIFCLVRTDPDAKPQEGISFLLIDMQSPGITVKPIVLIDGSPEVNEVFFDDVRVPVGNLVGEENSGWTYAKYLLTHERTNIAGVGFARAELDALRRIASHLADGDRPLIENQRFAGRLAEIEIELMAMATTNMRLLAEAQAGQVPGAESSLLKMKGTQIRQAINDLSRRAMGPWALAFPSEALEGANEDQAPPGPPEAAAAGRRYLNNRKLSIYGGSNEIQRSIVAKALLGM